MEVLGVQFFVCKFSVLVIHLLFNTGIKGLYFLNTRLNILCCRKIIKGGLWLINGKNIGFSYPLLDEFFC